MKLTTVDLFRKLPRDLSYGTSIGGLLTILVCLMIPVLTVLEVWTFLSGEMQTDVVIDPNAQKDLEINFNVTMLDLPCQFADVQLFDFYGKSRLGIDKIVTKSAVTGDLGEKFIAYHYDPPPSESLHNSYHPHHLTDIPEGFSVTHLTMANFQATLAENEYSFVNFYANWCHWCTELEPTWKAFAASFSDGDLPVKIYSVHCPDQSSLCDNQQRIRGLPTLRMFHGKKALHPDYKGDRTEEDMYNFVQNILDDYGDKVPTRRKDNVNAMASVREHSIEGCNIAGTFKVRRVPGTFTIEANAREHDFDPKSTNTSHVIHHFRFGGPLTNKQQSYIPPRMLHETDPLRNEIFLSEDQHTTHQHFIKLISTYFPIRVKEEILVYRMTTSNQIYSSEPNVPNVQIAYDLSPTAAVVTRGGRRWYEFLTNLCAIIGGVYVVFTLLDGFIFSTNQLIKSQVGKQQ